MPEFLTLPNRDLPTHVAIIMDGNGRWAKARGLPRTAGHRRGAEAVRRTMIGAAELGRTPSGGGTAGKKRCSLPLALTKVPAISA